jgi:cytochrome c oxidase subunit I
MPRRYAMYAPEFQIYNVLSTAGATILGAGYLIPMIYFTWSLKGAPIAGDNPWGARGLEWEIPSPPPTENFPASPIVTENTHQYAPSREVGIV